MSVKSELALLVLALILHDQVHTASIYGGHEAEPHSRPYMALVMGHMKNDKGHNCGGFLFNEDFVMTAAHCQATSYSVLLGVDKVQHPTNIQNISVEQAFPHKKYNSTDYSNDIMILKLSSKAHFNKNVQPIPLADEGDGSLPKSCSTSGWGRSEKYPYSITNVLMEVNVTLVKSEMCLKEHSYCSEGKAGPAKGDSGGPLVCGEGKAYGVVSTGGVLPNGLQLYAYSKIHDYKKWINLILKGAKKFT